MPHLRAAPDGKCEERATTTAKEIEARVRNDASALAGKVLLVSSLDGFAREGGVRHRRVDPPARARIIPESSSIVRWTGEQWCDPVYELELLDERPDLDDLTSIWVYGASYSLGGDVVAASFALVGDDTGGIQQPAIGSDRDEHATYR